MRLAALLFFSGTLWLATSAAHAQCAGGRVITPQSAGRCCWPGQSWSAAFGRCEGPPMCPAGTAASGDDCVGGQSVAVITPGYGYAPGPTRLVEQSLVWMIVTGTITLSVSYLLTIAVTAAVGSQGYEIGINAVPLAGPWICFGACGRPDDYAPALVASGLLQLTGLTFIILGAALHQSVVVYAAAERPALSLLPWATNEAGGLALSGSW